MEIRLAADLQTDSIVDGTGIRSVVWTQGCPHRCPGCHNSSTFAFDGGQLFDVEVIKAKFDKLEGQDGITFSGGDPMCQPTACLELAKHAKKLGLNIWLYTGYTYEQVLNLADKKNEIYELLKHLDVLVDGRFEIKKKSLDLLFRGSSNQRLIDVQKTLKAGKIVLLEEYIPTKGKKEAHMYI